MIKIKTTLNDIITFEEKDNMLIATMQLKISPSQQTYYKELCDIQETLKIDNLSDTVREILNDKSEEYKDDLIDALNSYCNERFDTYCELVED